jgi:hypothetical protein
MDIEAPKTRFHYEITFLDQDEIVQTVRLYGDDMVNAVALTMDMYDVSEMRKAELVKQ